MVFYFGPMRYSSKLGIQDFMSLELQNGIPVLIVNYGEGSVILDKYKKLNNSNFKLDDGKSHTIGVFWSKTVSRQLLRNSIICDQGPLYHRGT